jgi:hypothetical protein
MEPVWLEELAKPCCEVGLGGYAPRGLVLSPLLDFAQSTSGKEFSIEVVKYFGSF